MRDALAAEWLKLRSNASTYHALGVAACTVIAGVAWSFYVSGLADERESLRAAAPEQGFLPLVQVSLAVLGVLSITPEHATGMIRSSLTVVPRRGVLLLAKASVTGITTFVAANVIILLTYTTSRLIAGEHRLGFNQTALSDDLPMLFASGVSVTVLALVGLGLGVAMRSTAAAVLSLVALLFVLPGIANYLPAPWNTRAATIMLPNLIPQMAGQRLSSRLSDGFLSSEAAYAVLVAYALITLAVGFYLFKRRDA